MELINVHKLIAAYISMLNHQYLHMSFRIDECLRILISRFFHIAECPRSLIYRFFHIADCPRISIYRFFHIADCPRSVN